MPWPIALVREVCMLAYQVAYPKSAIDRARAIERLQEILP